MDTSMLRDNYYKYQTMDNDKQNGNVQNWWIMYNGEATSEMRSKVAATTC